MHERRLVAGQVDGGRRDRVRRADLYDRWHGYLAAGVRALIERGDIAADTDAGHAATAVLTAVSGGASLRMATGRLDYLTIALDQALRALRGREPATGGS